MTHPPQCSNGGHRGDKDACYVVTAVGEKASLGMKLKLVDLSYA